MLTVTVTPRGQITIPLAVRRKLRIGTGSQLDLFDDGLGGFVLRPRSRLQATLAQIDDGTGADAEAEHGQEPQAQGPHP
ncbi:MAG: AbrB/MazE/SpoVT family DNA-binding domain-containing protein [Bifidobacteriaceae bacterium]|jgi:AbrB family looped-hinge helix DNA binding protein|nr:AbrB/MazE/SpoVT family DNA-binding domain-containing protein [Bifidobacteriaceae bacterium]